MVKHIPNSLTLLNLFSGCCGIVACMQQEYTLVPIFLSISLLADFLDGFAARALNVKSELGGQLDSLADMVTFGVLPGIMLFNIIQAKTNFITTIAASSPINLLEQPLALVGFVYTLFACLRLAKFNLDTRQTENFIGLNTPSGALFILGFYMQFFSDWSLQSNWDFTIYAKIAAIIIPFVLAFLMIAEFPMFSLKGNPFSWKQNKFRLMLILSVIPQILLLKWLGLSTIILTYIIFAFIQNVNKNKN
ncbi:MAG: CDP-alcohol phosphatidyltransferase family protein [Chitinophagales bacterium]|nr:CDP-alcohol phosphatidyltransferase family protein [Chitinophagales bacterium]